MSNARFVCLANSYKEGGRCVAGIVLDAQNHPVREQGNPKWIRPICKTEYGEIPTHLVDNISFIINLLDVVKIEVSDYPDLQTHQPENALFDFNSLQVIGKYDQRNLIALYASHRLIFGNRGKAVAKENIHRQNHSLMFVKTNAFEVWQRVFPDNPKPQVRIKFTYCGNPYDLPVTDPVFLEKYQSNPAFYKDYRQMDMTLSLGIEHQDWYYKLIAGIILS